MNIFLFSCFSFTSRIPSSSFSSLFIRFTFYYYFHFFVLVITISFCCVCVFFPFCSLNVAEYSCFFLLSFVRSSSYFRRASNPFFSASAFYCYKWPDYRRFLHGFWRFLSLLFSLKSKEKKRWEKKNNNNTLN